jgi:predicted phage tail protein
LIEIVRVKNIFDRAQREVEKVEFLPGKTVAEYIPEYIATIENKSIIPTDIPEIEFLFIVNGNFIDQPELTYLCNNDQLVVIPHVGSGVGKILGTIASLALTAYAGNIIGGLWGGVFAKGTLAAYLAAGAVMYVGGRIINSVFNTTKNTSTSSNTDSDTTYGWSTPSVVSGEGGTIGITYGECIPTPQILQKHVETVNDKQYLNLLLCGGMGQVDSIWDIKLGGTAISNFTDVQIETRLGTNDQTPISFFENTTLDQAIGIELTEAGFTQTTDTYNAKGLEVTIEFPNGLYYANDDGSLGSTTVEIALYYKKTTASNWNRWICNLTNQVIYTAANGQSLNSWSNSNWLSIRASSSHTLSRINVTDVQIYATAATENITITCTRVYTTTTYNNTTIFGRQRTSTVFNPEFSIVGSISGYLGTITSGQTFNNGNIKFTLYASETVADKNLSIGDKGTIAIIGQNWIVSGAQNTAIRRSIKITGLEEAQYDVRAMVVSRQTGSRYGTTVDWSVLTSYLQGSYSRPNKVLIGLRILATNQLSGSIPNVTWRQIRNYVYVWNPDTNAYETRSARNPIWAAYDIYHQCRYMKNINTGLYEYHVFGVDKSRLIPHWNEWVEAAAYSDEDVLSTDGVTYENRFEFDYHYTTELKRYDAAQLAANVGHAVIIIKGNNIGIAVDKPGSIVQVFGEGRTTMSSFSGTFTGTEDRANSVEVIYSDTTKDFVNTQFLIRSPKWNTDESINDNPAQLTLKGVKRKSQAYREGVYTLATNLLQVQFVDISTDVDSMMCQYGDLVGLNHSVAQIGIASGRIVTATTNTVILDKSVTLSVGYTYQIILQLSADDSLVTKNIVPVSTEIETNVLTVTQPFTTIPRQFDNYVFGETDKAVKPFRLVGVEKSGDLTVKLSLAEYVPGIYTGDLNYPVIDYTPPTSKIQDPISVSLAEENYSTPEGMKNNNINVSWLMNSSAQYDQFLVYYSKDGTNYALWTTTYNLSTTITGVKAKIKYYIKIVAVKDAFKSTGKIASITTTGVDALPPDVISLLVETLADKTRRFTWEYIFPSTNDVAGFKIKYKVGSSTDWNTATTLQSHLILSSPFETQAFRNSDVYTIMIKAVDNAGNESKNIAYAVINLGDQLVNNVLFTDDMSDFAGTKTDCYIYDGRLISNDSGGKMWSEDENTAMWTSDSALFYNTIWPAMTYQDTFLPDASGLLSFDFTIEGNYTIWYRRKYPYSMWTTDNDYMWTSDSKTMWKEGPWVRYAGKVETTPDIHEVKVEIDSGYIRPTIIKLIAIVDVDDVIEYFNDIIVPVTGLRLPITKKYIKIKNVSATIQDIDDTTALTVRIVDKNPTSGPLIMLYDKNNNAVNGCIDATIQGYY